MHLEISEFPVKEWYPHGVADAPNTKAPNYITRHVEDFMRRNLVGKEMMQALPECKDGKIKTLEGIKMRRLAIDVPTAYAQGKLGRLLSEALRILMCWDARCTPFLPIDLKVGLPL